MNRLAVPFHGRIIGFPYWNKVGGAAPNPLASVPWVAQWKFNNDGNDSIGANHLTNNNSATFTTGKLGGATGATQLVKASGQYWSIADNAALSTGNVDFLVCAWVYMDTLSPLTRRIVSKAFDVGANDEYYVDYNSGTSRFRFIISDGAGHFAVVSSDTFGAPSLSTWYFVAAWHDATADTINININNTGTDATAYVWGSVNGNRELCIGSTSTAPASYWDGRIDNVCIAKGTGAVPTQAVLDALYNSGNGTETLT